MKSFDLNLTNSDGSVNLEMTIGYSRCLEHFYNQLVILTEFSPEKRYVDAVDLLDIISATSDNVSGLMKRASKELRASDKLFTNILHPVIPA